MANNKFMVSVTSKEQFYEVAQFAKPNSDVGDMYDNFKTNSVVIVDIDNWYYTGFKRALELKEEFGFPISFEEFKMRYIDNVQNDTVMTYKDEVKVVSENVNHPSHYKQFSREVIDTMQGVSTPEEFKGYLKLNAIKYISRYQGKNGAEDLEKAVWYINKLKEVVENEKDSQTK